MNIKVAAFTVSEKSSNINSKEVGKCEESIQLLPHLTQNTLWESDKRTRKRHIEF